MLTFKINELKQKIMEMASLVEKMATLSFQGVETGSHSRFKQVMEYEGKVNQLETEIDELCIMLIALHHPEAKDLRLILMIYRINNDLERLADQAVNIAESSSMLAGNPIIEQVPELVNMKNAALKMLADSIMAYTNEDTARARLVCKQDEIVDSYNRHITALLIHLMKESPLQIEYYLHVLRIAKNLERIADLSTNIGENTIYLTQGRVIKHHQEEANPEL